MNDLQSELKRAYESLMDARQALEIQREVLGGAKSNFRDARDRVDRALDVMDQVVREIATGETGLPLFGGANGNGHATTPDAKRAAMDAAHQDAMDRFRTEPVPPGFEAVPAPEPPLAGRGRKRKGVAP